MKARWMILGAWLSSLGAMAQVALPPTSVSQNLTEASLRAHLSVLAHDSLEGRATAQPGQKKAARYIAQRFRDYGLLPIVPKASGDAAYYQSFRLVKRRYTDISLRLAGGKTFVYLQDFIPSLRDPFSWGGEVTSEVVLVGYGIETPQYNDYLTVEATNRTVLILDGEPQNADSTFLLTGSRKPSEWQHNWRKKIEVAKERGAAHILCVSEAFDRQVRQAKHALEEDPPMAFPGSESEQGVFYIPYRVAAEITGLAEAELRGLAGSTTLTTAESRQSKPFRKRDVGIAAPIRELVLKAQIQADTLVTENVGGLLKGSSKPEEILVVTAHYDHIGVQNGEVYNGADDDGTGTSTVLELARLFSQAAREGQRPERSILFLCFTGEEKGLLGSRYYSENPLFPLEKTVCNLNIDMIGRVDQAHETNHNYVYLIGSDKLSLDLHQLSEAVNKASAGLQLDYTFNDEKDPNRFYYRSDHYNFARKGVPVIFYFSGVHADYHQPGDEIDKILFPKYAKTARLVLDTAWAIAFRKKGIVRDKKGEE